MDITSIAATATAIKKGINYAQRILNPILIKMEKELSGRAQLAAHNFLGGYSKYLENAYERHSYINSIVFMNQQRKLVDYYIPLTIKNDSNQAPIKIDKYPIKEFEEIKRILIQDTAGMGKSTILKYLFLECINCEAGIPVLLELRKLNKHKTLSHYIGERLSDTKGNWNEDVFLRILESGKFIFFFDGYDEIAEQDRVKVTSDLQNFIEKSPNNTFIISSRAEAGLGAFPSFLRHNILPLTTDESFNLIRKYAPDERAERLISKLKLPENKPIHEFLKNPLLTSLLFRSFEFKPKIPLKRHIFYRQVYESLFETHDLSKEGGEFDRKKKSGLDIDRFEKLLCAFGACTYKNKLIEMDKNTVLNQLDVAKNLTGEKKLVASNFLYDLTHAVPLLIEEGTQLRWAHKSIQEYFAAIYISRSAPETKLAALNKLFEPNERLSNFNLLSLCAEIDRRSYDQVISKILCEKLIVEYDNLYSTPQSLDESLLQERKTIVTGKGVFFIFKNSLLELDEPERRKQINKLFDFMDTFCPQGHFDNKQLFTSGIGGATVGQARDPIEIFINPDHSAFQYDFIEPLKPNWKITSSDKWPTQFAIDDIAESPSNRSETFQMVTEALYNASRWKFSRANAALFLEELNNDLNNKSNEPW